MGLRVLLMSYLQRIKLVPDVCPAHLQRRYLEQQKNNNEENKIR